MLGREEALGNHMQPLQPIQPLEAIRPLQTLQPANGSDELGKLDAAEVHLSQRTTARQATAVHPSQLPPRQQFLSAPRSLETASLYFAAAPGTELASEADDGEVCAAISATELVDTFQTDGGVEATGAVGSVTDRLEGGISVDVLDAFLAMDDDIQVDTMHCWDVVELGHDEMQTC